MGESIHKEIQRTWNPVSFRVTEIHVIVRYGTDGQFLLAHRVPLGDTHVVDNLVGVPTPYPLMPKEPPEFCIDRRKGGKGARGKSSRMQPDRRSPNLAEVPPEAVEAAFAALPGVGPESARALSAWVHDGKYSNDARGFIFPSISDKGQRGAVHGAVRRLLSPLVSDTNPEVGGGLQIRVRAPEHAPDARRW